jgi:hypothetical protein
VERLRISFIPFEVSGPQVLIDQVAANGHRFGGDVRWDKWDVIMTTPFIELAGPVNVLVDDTGCPTISEVEVSTSFIRTA